MSQATSVDGSRLLSRILQIEDRTETLPGNIALAVARDIIEGRLAAGDDLNSIDLANRFETSRTPVREGLMMLEKAGLVTINARRRPHVIRLTPDQIADIYMLRGRLYSFVAELISERVDDDGIDQLVVSYEVMRSAAHSSRIDDYFWANVSFHDLSARLASSEALRRSIDSLGGQVLRLRHISMSLPGRKEASLADHGRLIQAYRDRDSTLAAALNQSIVRGAHRALTKALGADQTL